jgi:nicotinamide-nucleotide amidase
VVSETKEIFSQKLHSWLAGRFSELAPKHTSFIKCFGLSESHIGTVIEQCALPPDVRVGYRPMFPEVLVKFTFAPASTPDAAQIEHELVSKVISAVGEEFVFSRNGDDTLGDAVGRLLAERKLRLAVAESCTGGAVANLIVSRPGASEYFEASAVTYSNESKEILLGVTSSMLERCGAVSKEVAGQMAYGLKQRLGVDIAVSITGIAGPEGGTAQKPVGTVWFGLCQGQTIETVRHEVKFERNRFRSYAAALALDLVRRHLLGLELKWTRL